MQHPPLAADLPDPGLAAFGHDPWWVILLKAVFIFLILVLLTLFNIWFERRVVARMQHRVGPNVHGPFGLLQSLADGVKLALKEDIVPKAADKVVFLIAPIIAVVPAFVTWAVIPLGPEVNFFGHRDPAAAHRHAGGRALHARHRLDRHLRHRARRLVLRLDVLPARRPALERPDDLLRGRDGPRARGGLPLRRLDVDLGDRRRAGPAVVRPDPAAVVRDLRDLDGRRDQPRPLRPPRGRGRAGRRLPHRVLQPEVRAVLPRRVHQPRDRVGHRHHAVPRRLGGPVGHRERVGGRQQRLLAAAVVLRQGLHLHLPVRLAARLAAPHALRPVHGAGLEGPDPGLAGLDRGRRHHPRHLARGQHQPHLPRGRDRRPARPHRRADVRRRPGRQDRRAERGRGERRAARRVRRRLPRAADARGRRRTRCRRAADVRQSRTTVTASAEENHE